MSKKSDTALMAHLMRRAGFGATKAELEDYLAGGYEQTVETLLAPEGSNSTNDALIRRYHPDHSATHDVGGAGSYWLYRLISTKEPLKEKIALFWHNIFATGYAKVTNGKPLSDQLRMFRDHGMGSLDNLLLQLSRDPAMIIWLDNIDNHDGAINENFGRELLELFSMGVGNYTEDDIKECSRAFTGWTVANADYTKQLAVRNSIWPYGKLAWRYEYDEEDHDDGPKTFLGETGNFNGEDIIDIICKQPAAARFISRHMYHFFVADEPPVPQWPYKPPRDIDAVKLLEKAYFDSHYNITEMLRVLFNSDFFKNARFAKIKSPAEVVVGNLRLVGGAEIPAPGIGNLSKNPGYMGQELLNPPSVEGWHTGVEWINSGALMKRINFPADMLGDVNRPGIRDIIDRLKALGDLLPEDFVEHCLDLVGPVQVRPETRQQLVARATEGGAVSWSDAQEAASSTERVGEMLQLIASVREYQYN